jgi:hypothetical protein
MMVFSISDEALAKAGEVKCGGCNWSVSSLYALAESQDEADSLFLSGDAGLCGDCLCELLVNGGDGYDYEISPSPLW